MSPATAVSPVEPIEIVSQQEVKTPVVEKQDVSIKRQILPTSTENIVKLYFSDIPIMSEIARCESEFRHLNSDGKVLRGVVNGNDVGVMQINETFHLKRSKNLGYDIYTIDGNLGYARKLYEEQGARPWLASSACWTKPSPELAKKI